MGNQALPQPPSQEEEDLARLKMEYRLSDCEVKCLYKAVLASFPNSHEVLTCKLFRPGLPPVLLEDRFSFLANFVSLQRNESSNLFYYASKLCHLYSLIVRPAFQPFPSQKRDRTLLEALFTHAVGDDADVDRIASVFFSYWGDAVQDHLTKSFSAFIATTTPTSAVPPATDPLSGFLSFVAKNLPSLHVSIATYFGMPLLEPTLPPQPPSPSLPPLHTLLRLHFNDSYDPDWAVLFDSSSDGSSFHRYCAKLEGYDQPTLTVIELNCGVEIGVYSTSVYKEAPNFESPASSSFLFTTHPHFTVHILRERSREPHHQYLNPSSRSKNRDNLPHGVGWGGFTSQGEGGFR